MAATPLTLTQDNFEETVKKGGILFIDFWAEWCGPCRAFAPVFAAAAAKHPDLTFGKVDTEAQQELAAAFQVQAIPTLAIFRDGVLLGRNAGALPAAALEDVIAQVRALDMDKVRAELEAEKQQQPG